jgi:hypothetical protein
MLEIPFAFEIGGKAINPAELDDPAEKELLQNIVDSIVDRVEDMKCPVHNQHPRFLCHGDSIDDLSLEVLGCCDGLVDMVRNRLDV